MSSLSAADLQRRHGLEGAPDPFPSLTENSNHQSAGASSVTAVDTNSEAAFPSLAPAAPAKPTTAGTWATPRITKPIAKQSGAQETLTLPSIDLNQVAGKGKAPTILEYQKTIGSKFRVTVTSVQQRTSGHFVFTIKGESERDVAKARKHIIISLSPSVSLKVEAPNSVIPSIIGPHGSTISAIRDQTHVRIDIPRKEVVSVPTNGHATPGSGPSPIPPAEDDEEPTTVVTITGPESLAREAQTLIMDIITSKRAKSTSRIQGIPKHIASFLAPRRAEFVGAAEGFGEVTTTLDRQAGSIAVTGDREAVKRVVEAINATIEELKTSLTPLKMGLPKKQHRLLTQAVLSEIMANTRCGVTVPSPEDPSNEITVWGYITQGSDLSAGLQAVLTKVNSQHAQEFTLPPAIASDVLTYITRTQYVKNLQSTHSGIAVHLPTEGQIKNGETLTIDFVGKKETVEAAVASLAGLIAKLNGATRNVHVDWLLHSSVQAKASKKIKAWHDVHNVSVYFPDGKLEKDAILLVYDPLSSREGSATDSLELVEKEILAFAKEAGSIKHELVPVDRKWHDAVAGKDGTTLNAIIGENRVVSIKLGPEALGSANGSVDGGIAKEDLIVVRGTPSEVDRAVKEILRIVENAKNDEIDNSYVVEFEIGREYVGRIVGAGGAGVNKLRDQLGVRLDFVDEADEKDRENGKKKKTSSSSGKAKVKIVGRRENVEEAQKRIINQADRLADEVSEVLHIPRQYHSSLIGSSGKYVIRLEDKYAVKITFPRESNENGEGKTREHLKPDEVLLKGGKKGVASAKAEILEVVEFEKESNNIIKFSVPSRAVARILGKGGASINEIKDATDAQIDIDKADSNPDVTNVTVRGTKKAIAAAKAAILAISDQIGEEITEVVQIESKYHRTIIGAGGQGLRELIQRCGGPSEPRAQAGLVHFPRPGETGGEVRLRGERSLVKKIKAELEKAAAGLRDRVVLGVLVPAVQHKALIGRGGQHLTDLQTRTGVQVQFPGSRSYSSVGEPENASDFENAEPADMVKVMGPRAACEAAIKELKGQIKVAAEKPAPQLTVQETIPVPHKYHHFINQQGNLLRSIRSFNVVVDQSSFPTKPAVPSGPPVDSTAAPRIDEEDAVPSNDVQWQVIPNYQDADAGTSEWTLKARDQASLDKAKKVLLDALKSAEEATHVGFLTLPDRTAFPRIVGSKGATVARLRAETGADITVSRETNNITVIGSLEAVETAKEAILNVVNTRAPRRGDH
ncbi:hypothetical protein SISNIDRAFT_481189 [Sistotremastrum niveocremeum HHB9708]|uniref:K Homology domain-containing protein n=1 Tax=Sistotremastrum niveocremeum HHB9708 TaxID=1314777 RepID=A0A165A3Z1_9AGAM|nr:hypothetical protein SISNIDRAFT_481189 [Sistotremastrum niveocremeum HHB9708]